MYNITDSLIVTRELLILTLSILIALGTDVFPDKSLSVVRDVHCTNDKNPSSCQKSIFNICSVFLAREDLL